MTTRPTFETTHCPYCKVNLRDLPAEENPLLHVSRCERESAKPITADFFLEHETKYTQHREWYVWECSCGAIEEERFKSWDECHRHTREHWAEVINRRSTAVPSPSLASVLREHWLFAIECHHEAKTDQAVCACGLKTQERENVGAAVQDWIQHVAKILVPEDARS